MDKFTQLVLAKKSPEEIAKEMNEGEITVLGLPKKHFAQIKDCVEIKCIEEVVEHVEDQENHIE